MVHAKAQRTQKQVFPWRTLRLCVKFIRHANCEASGFLSLSYSANSGANQN